VRTWWSPGSQAAPLLARPCAPCCWTHRPGRADRAQHVAERIAPALAAGHWVLSDRFSGSTVAYQGYGRGLSLEAIQQLDAFATGGLRPDLTLWLDVPLKEALQRLAQRNKDRIEAEGEEFLRSVRLGYMKQCPDPCWAWIDEDGGIDDVHFRCREEIKDFLAWRLTLRE
jgi:dTMP kinase